MNLKTLIGDDEPTRTDEKSSFNIRHDDRQCIRLPRVSNII